MITTQDVVIALLVGLFLGIFITMYLYETFVVSKIETKQFKRQNETLTQWYNSTPRD